MNTPAPRYRLRMGRPDRDMAPAATRILHTHFPQELFDAIIEDCSWTDVGAALSNSHRATVSDYVRAAVVVFNRLLASGTRERTLALANLPERRMADLISHIEYVNATLPGEPEREAKVLTGDPQHPAINTQLHEAMYMRQEGIAASPITLQDGSVYPNPKWAPLSEKDPWNRL